MINRFIKLRTTKKGKAGEDIVKSFLQSTYMIYIPSTNAPHCVDFAMHKIGDKAKWSLAEVKTKSISSPFTTTGFNENNFIEYLQMLEGKHKLDTFIFFVDAAERKTYGNWISILKDKVVKIIIDPRSNKKIVMFERKDLIDIFHLTDEDIIHIKQYDKI